jgi:hypothetical protein
MEAEWMKQIPSESICNFFYFFFIVYAVLFVLSILATIGVFTFTKKLGAAGIAIGLQGVIMTIIPGVFTLFYYIICDRALLATKKQDMKAMTAY